ncbi:MAG: polyhydroxyalkanoate synthesis regulator DNA-binding domain-containing protein [bacterium]|nr:polyhydroxyalkanoate synthesis regulator DNA-binding domain-containing protein [bacterium]
MQQKIVIKRYKNRKLYDMSSSSYITLAYVSELVKHGHEVMVIDEMTGEDITQVILAHVLLEEEKKVAKIPERLLRGIMGSKGGVLGDFYKKKVASPFFSWCEDVEKRIHEIKNLRSTIIDLEKRVKALEAAQKKTQSTNVAAKK